MHHRTTLRPVWTTAIAFAMIAALFAAIGSSPAAAQSGPVITDPGPQSHDVGHRSCTGLQASAPVDNWAGRGNVPPGVGIDPDQVDPTRARLGGTPTRPGNYSFEIRAESDDLGDGPWLTINYRVFTPDPSVPVIKAGKLAQAFTIDCFSQNWLTNELLSDPDNFGPSGTVRLASGLPVHEHTEVITAEYLADADILFDGFVAQDSYSASELRLIRRWVDDGGVLVAAEDATWADGLGELFGAPTQGFVIPASDTNDGDPWLHCGNPADIPNSDDIPGQPECPLFTPAGGAGSHPIVNGPFGRWSSIETDGTVGYLTRRTPSGFTRVADHPNGRATIVERKVGNGHVIIVTDEGTFRTGLDRQNDQYIGNLFAFAISQVTEVPETGNDVLTGRAFRRFRADICRNDQIGDGPSRVRITGGSLGPDLRLRSRSCRIVGTPRNLGNWQATYTITDSDGDTDTGRISVTINGAFGADPSNPTCKGQPATIIGTPGADLIRGTRGNDVIVAGNGADIIRGLRGNDIICGGKGADTIIGGGGRDVCAGGPGRDRVRGCESRRR